MQQQQTEYDKQESTRQDSEWLSVQETARQLGVHSQTIRKMIAAGIIPAIGIGRDYRLRLADVVSALAIRRP